MKSRLGARDALAMVPGVDVDALEIRKLPGGLSNRSFLIVGGDSRWVLRLDPHMPGAFQPDRRLELCALQTASAAGLAPRVIFAEPAMGVLICNYVEGHAFTQAELEDDSKLRALAGLLRAVHSLPHCGTRLQMSATAKIYAKYIERNAGPNAFADYCVELIASMPRPQRVSFCHNDIVAGNVIGNGTLKLIDWEFAGDNDPLFDLASLIGFHDLDEHRVDVLLRAYCEVPDERVHDRLQQQRVIYDAIQWLWLAARQQDRETTEQAVRLAKLQKRIRASA